MTFVYHFYIFCSLAPDYTGQGIVKWGITVSGGLPCKLTYFTLKQIDRKVFFRSVKSGHFIKIHINIRIYVIVFPPRASQSCGQETAKKSENIRILRSVPKSAVRSLGLRKA